MRRNCFVFLLLTLCPKIVECRGMIAEILVHSTEITLNGGWSSWSGWSGCATGQCSGDQKIRTRTCTNPLPDSNGKYCEGPNAERADCAVPGGWSEWGQWSMCDNICGGSVINRTRTCDNPSPTAGGASCKGKSVETKLECTWPCEIGPQDGEWGPWSHWSKCPQPCGLSPGVYIHRTRRCDSPPPQNGGKDCLGSAKESVLSCFTPCPVDGAFSAWSQWSSCSKSCNRGMRTRDRKCDSPFPDHGGKSCAGPEHEQQPCKIKDCPGSRAGGWSSWGPFSQCSESRLCFAGTKKRSRTCTNPPPLGEGDDCEGTGVEVRQCPTPEENCGVPHDTLPDKKSADVNSFIALECESTKKYSVKGSHGNSIPSVIFTGSYKTIAEILKSGYFAKKADGDKTKYCFEPQDTLFVRDMVAIVTSYNAADLLPSFEKPSMSDNVPGVAFTVDQSQILRQTEFQCGTADEYTPVTGFVMKNVRFTFYTEGLKYSFQAKGDLTRVQGVPFKSLVTQVSGALEASGSAPSLRISQISDLAGFPVYQYPTGVKQALQDAKLWDLELQPASYTYSMKALSTFRFTGSVTVLGIPVHVEMLTNPGKGRRMFAVGFTFDGESFGALSKRLSGIGITFLDSFGIELQIGVSYAPSQLGAILISPETNYAKEPLHSLITGSIPKDLFIGARVALPKDCKESGFCTICKQLLGPDVAFVLSGHIQQNSIRVTAGFRDIRLTKDVSFSKIELFVEANYNNSQQTLKLGFVAEVKIAVNQGEVVRDGVKSPAPAIHVGGIIEYEIQKQVLGGALYMKGMWRKAFGIRWLAIGFIVLGIKWQIGAPTPTGGYFGGRVEIGSNCWTAADFKLEGHCVGGSAYFGLGDPQFIYVQITALTIGKIFRLVAPNLKLPPPIEDSGFPRGALFSYASEAIDLTFFGGPSISKGITFDGAVNFLGYTVDAKVKYSDAYILADIKLDPINWKNLLTIRRSPSKKDLGPWFFVEWKKEPFYIKSQIEGYVNVLGISVYANMNLTMTQFQLLVQGNFLNLIKAEVFIAASYARSFEMLKFYAKVSVDLSGLNKALDEAASAVKGAFDAAQRQLRSAQDNVRRKKEECKRKMSLKCDKCRTLKCTKAKNDCKNFMDKAGKWIGGAINKVGNFVKNTAKKIGKALAPVGKFFKKVFKGWKRKREIERMRNDLFEQHIRRRRFISKVICEGVVGGGCQAVSILCEGSCRAVEFISKGLCHVLDVAVGVLKLAEVACGWISSAIQFVLTQLFRIHSIKFEVGIDNSVGGRVQFAAAVDFTIFGKRLYLNLDIDLTNPAAAIKKTGSKGVEEYKKKANPKSKSDINERVYDSPNPYSDFELSEQFTIENTQSATEDESRSGACLYSPSKNNGALLRLTSCDEYDERQLFSYNFKGLLVSSYSKLCVDIGGDSIGSKLRQTTCNLRSDNQHFECDLEVRTIKRRRTDLCWTAGKTSVNGPGSLVQASSFKCIHPQNGGYSKPPSGTRLQLYSTCSESRLEFMLEDGYLKHKSGMCVAPVGRVSDGVELGLYSNCNGNKFGFTKGGSIKHLGSGKCIQSRQEVDKPSDGDVLVLRSKCENNDGNRERLIFTFIPTDSHIRLERCTYFDEARLDQRFEVMDESLATICSKYAKNLAERKPVEQSSTSDNGFASRAVDGMLSTLFNDKSCSMTKQEPNPWWRLDLMQEYVITDVTILNRATKGERLNNFEVRIGNDKHNYKNNPTCHDRVGKATSNEAVRVQCKPPLPGRYVRVQMFGSGILSMCEVLVYSRLGGYGDLCLLGNGGCDQICYNSCGRKVQCACGTGYKLAYDGKTCLDYDECLVNNGGCQQKCINIPGGRLCDCKNGYTLKENSETECEDYNECGLNSAGCEHICRNTAGSYMCDCRKGFKLRANNTGCEDIDECKTNNGDCAHKCHNYVGGYWCSCNNGYKLMTDLHGCEEKLCPALVTPFRATLGPSICQDKRANIHRNTKCSYSCQTGYELVGEVTQRTCQLDGTFSGQSPYCRPLYCPKVKVPANGAVLPASCGSNPSGSEFGQRCVFYCAPGYELRGPRYKSCQADQSWSETMESTCERVYKNPWIVCPNYLEVTLGPTQSKVALGDRWKLPDSNMKTLTVSPNYLDNKYEFPAGKTLVTWTATNDEGSMKSCSYQVVVKDTTPPTLVSCPSDVDLKTTASYEIVHWTEPTFTDNVGITNRLQTKTSGSKFTRGSVTTVHYIVYDAAGNSADCKFSVTIQGILCNMTHLQPPRNGQLRWLGRSAALIMCNPNYHVALNYDLVQCHTPAEAWFVTVGGKKLFTKRAPDCTPAKPVAGGACDSGYMIIKNQYCVPCLKGSYRDSGRKECELCPLNTYADQNGMVACQLCPKGTVTLTTGATQASDCIAQCKPGTFSSNGLNDAESPCQSCPVSTYQPNSAGTTCLPCPDGMTTGLPGSSTLKSCAAPAKISETIPNSSATVYVGEQLTLECFVEGDPSPTIVLDRVGASLPSSSRVLRSPLYSLENKQIGLEVYIKEVKSSDGGTYKCSAQNASGREIRQFTIIVKDRVKKRSTDDLTDDKNHGILFLMTSKSPTAHV